VVGEYELLLGRYFYEREFVGKAPVLDLAPGRCWFTKQNPDDIYAVDLAPEIVAHYAAEGLKIKEGSAYDIPTPTASSKVCSAAGCSSTWTIPTARWRRSCAC
jgi:hypothetical protein